MIYLYSCNSKRHFLTSYLIQEVGKLLKQSNVEEERLMGICVVRNLLWKHCFDERYTSIRFRISTMYFPYLLLVLENPSALKELPLEERRNWLICWLYILKDLEISFIVSWLKCEDEKRLLELSRVFALCLETFEVCCYNNH